MKRIIVVSLLLHVVGVLCYCQESKIALIGDVTVSKPDSCETFISKTDTIICKCDEKYCQDSLIIRQLKDSVIFYRDSISILRETLKAKVEENDKMLHELYLSDTLMIVSAARKCKDKPFNEESLKKIIGYFDLLHQPQMRKDYQDLYQALTDYAPCKKEILVILKTAQDDSARENPFSENYIKKYEGMLKTSTYYKKYMEKKVRYRIEYLYDIVNRALNLLSKHTGDNPVDFSELLK